MAGTKKKTEETPLNDVAPETAATVVEAGQSYPPYPPGYDVVAHEAAIEPQAEAGEPTSKSTPIVVPGQPDPGWAEAVADSKAAAKAAGIDGQIPEGVELLGPEETKQAFDDLVGVVEHVAREVAVKSQEGEFSEHLDVGLPENPDDLPEDFGLPVDEFAGGLPMFQDAAPAAVTPMKKMREEGVPLERERDPNPWNFKNFGSNDWKVLCQVGTPYGRLETTQAMELGAAGCLVRVTHEHMLSNGIDHVPGFVAETITHVPGVRIHEQTDKAGKVTNRSLKPIT